MTRRQCALLSVLVFGAVTFVPGRQCSAGSWVSDSRWDLLTARDHHGCAVDDNGLIYAIGGRPVNVGPPYALSSAERFDESTGIWTPITSMLTARSYVGSATDFLGRIYAVGGRDNALNVLSSAERYDPRTKAWSAIAPMHVARLFPTIVSDHLGRIYAIGGATNSDGNTLTDSVERYDPVTNTWTLLATLPAPRICGQAAAVDSRGRIYVIGGTTVPWQTYTRTVLRYDTVANSWSSVGDSSFAGWVGAATAGPDNYIYTMGGYGATGLLGVVQKYDEPTDTWLTPSSLFRAVNNSAAAVSVAGNVYVVGGQPGSGGPIPTVQRLKVSAAPIESVKAIGDGALQLRGITGSGVKVGVLENSQVDSKCSLFAGRLMGQDFAQSQPANYEGYHATQVAAVLAGVNSATYRGTGYQTQILSSGISPLPSNFSFILKQALVEGDAEGHTSFWNDGNDGADVVNICIGPARTSSPDNSEPAEKVIDRAVDYYGMSVVVAAGNKSKSNYLPVPAAAFNAISVGGAGTTDGIHYNNVWAGNSVPGTSDGNRSKPDIIAPAMNVQVPWFDGSQWQMDTESGGTSLATPHVTGVVAQLCQVAKEQSDPLTWKDPRVIKAVLLTGAQKLTTPDTPTQAIGQTPWRHSRTHPLDTWQGAGLLDAKSAYETYAYSRRQPGTVPIGGWDLGFVPGAAGQQDYQLSSALSAGDQIIATLAWNRRVEEDYATTSMNNLGLSLFRQGTALVVAESVSQVDNVEHIVYTVPYGLSGIYTLSVGNISVSGETYGLAWRLLRQGVEIPKNLVTNGDFATGNFLAWALTGTPTVDPQDEGYGDYFAARLENDEVIRQMFEVPSNLKVAFDYQFDGAPGSSASLWVSIGDVVQQSIQIASDDTGLHRFEMPFDVTGLVGQNLDLIFAAYTSGPGIGVYLDSILVTPEPATLSLLALGGLVTLLRKRR